jgi:hypothetical protein
MANKALPEQSVLLQLLRYEPETGKLFWRERGVEWFEGSAARSASHIGNLWNVRYAGREAFTAVNGNGYFSGHILGSSAVAHRIIWKLVHGYDPDQIDHINGSRIDNRVPNLREVSAAENTQNQKRRDDNTTGMTGIYRYAHERKHMMWLVRIGSKHIGYFDCIGQAIAARRAAEIKHGFHPNHGRAA